MTRDEQAAEYERAVAEVVAAAPPLPPDAREAVRAILNPPAPPHRLTA